MRRPTGSRPANANEAKEAASRPAGEGRPLPVGTRPFSRFEWLLALRYMRPRRKRSSGLVIALFSLLGIMIGVGTLIIVMAVMNGLRAELIDKILGLNGHLIIQPMDSKLTDYAAVADRIARVPGVVSAVPFVEGQALGSGSNASSGVVVRGIREADLPKVRGIADNIRLGTLAGFDQSGGIAIGTRLATALGLTTGSDLTLVSPRGNVTPLGVTPRIKAYPVVAIFEIGMYEYDSSFVFIPFEEAQAYFNLDDEATAIEVVVDDPDAVDALRPAIEAAADRQILVTDWQERNVTFFSALKVERNVMFVILMLIVLVAALNIISGLTMLVKDKAKGIAILRTMGATRRSILSIFVIAGAAIGVGGTIFGLILGLTIAWNVESLRQAVSWLSGAQIFPPELYFLSRLPSEVRTSEVVAIVVMALTLSLMATIYPAWRAAKLDPVEALRGE